MILLYSAVPYISSVIQFMSAENIYLLPSNENQKIKVGKKNHKTKHTL